MDDVQVLAFDPIVLHGHMAAVSEQCLKIVESIDCLILFLVVLALAFCFLFMEVVEEVQDTTYECDTKKYGGFPLEKRGFVHQFMGKRRRLDSMV
ncbi:hypothetical protein AB5N19_06188 [Seiridium cardinale]